MIRKLKNVFISIISLFVLEVIVVGFTLPEIHNGRTEKLYSKKNIQKNGNYINDNFQHANKIPTDFIKYFNKYIVEKNKNSSNRKWAIALALDSNNAWTAGYAYSKNQQYQANKWAIDSCKNGISKYNIQAKCKIYAEGDHLFARQNNIEEYLRSMITNNIQSKTTKSHSGNYKVVKIRSNDTLNVRTGAGTYNRKIGGLAYNAINIKVVGCKKISNGEKWCNIRHHSINGWVSAKYLQREEKQNRRVSSNDDAEVYYAKISQRDHYGLRNRRLTDVASILQQDRANYHKYHQRDREDTSDSFFTTRNNRDRIKRMLARGYISQSTRKAIQYGNPNIKVKIYSNRIEVTAR